MLFKLWMLRLSWQELSYWLKVIAGIVRPSGPRFLLGINELTHARVASPASRRVPTQQGLRATNTGYAADSSDFILDRVMVSCLCCYQVKLSMRDKGWSPVDICGLSVGGWAQGSSWEVVPAKAPHLACCSFSAEAQLPSPSHWNWCLSSSWLSMVITSTKTAFLIGVGCGESRPFSDGLLK